MSLLPGLLSIALLFAVFASVAKLAALLYRRTRLAWLHALVYVVLILVLVAVVGGINRALGVHLPLIIAGILSLAAQALLGGWYLGPRAHTKDGEPLEFKRGAILGAVFYTTTVALFVLLALIYFAVRPNGAA